MGRIFLNYFETIYGLGNMDWSNGDETIRDESIIGLRTCGGPETMTP
jgi:hypothetical protein